MGIINWVIITVVAVTVIIVAVTLYAWNKLWRYFSGIE